MKWCESGHENPPFYNWIPDEQILTRTRGLTKFVEDSHKFRYTIGLDRISVNVLSPDPDTNHERTQTASKQWMHHDRLGSTVNSTDEFGRLTERTDYNEWGEITFHEPLRNVLGYRAINVGRTYTNHDYDVVLDQYYAKARMYDPMDKRFVQMDWIEGTPIIPETQTPYVYVKNNPNIYVDPNGLIFYENSKIKKGAGAVEDFSSNDAENVLLLQLQLMCKGVLSYEDFESSFGYVNDATYNAINKYKKNAGLKNDDASTFGIVGETTWRHLGLKVVSASRDEISMPSFSDDYKVGVLIAKYLLNSSSIMAAQSPTPVYVNSSSIATLWSPANFTYAAYYYDSLQCALRAQGLTNVVIGGVNIAEAGVSSFVESLAIAGPNPIVVGAGTITLTAAKLSFDDGSPSIAGLLEETVGKRMGKKVEVAAGKLDAILATDLVYVIDKRTLYSYIDYKLVRNMTLNQMADAITTLRTYRLKVSPYNEAEVRNGAISYLRNMMQMNIDVKNNSYVEKAALQTL